ncbi:hypothetical protein A2609_01275 [Candidatus Kaiserbacteria bacterium RIFOXYD1_FULL_47_14]|uniref:Uncharacterized protein n=1 Tax=Candidatus Kaiserbacteria bacterium RIFOXYD1_FULL_47_14 TaxID=1798533 RepID=A0A1F6G3V4_9BACT|nr:MAG: hypothetical protein A2609_01275 [Candidatus Kaiserbacteria bacterium RIFOXYD1_FULL_47_14]
MIENTEPGECTDIEKNVMRRVRLIRILGLIISTIVLAIATFVFALWGIGKEVWVARVFQNMPQSGDFTEIVRFYISAFGHTRFIVQALAVFTFVSFIYLARETIRALSSFFTHAHA